MDIDKIAMIAVHINIRSKVKKPLRDEGKTGSSKRGKVDFVMYYDF